MTKEMLNIQDYCDYMFPTSKKEVEALGWDYIDIIFFTGDAFVDHPSFYRIAVVPQPNWRDDLRDFRKLGAPRLYFAVNSGAMDSMVNHYTAAKRLRHDDAYTPDGRAGQRPDYAVSVYTKILKELFPRCAGSRIMTIGRTSCCRRFWSGALRTTYAMGWAKGLCWNSREP